ncbi:hypothetical protein BD311DRAFT_386409 [Dichomitus squalens]|uniref:Uncharacterized protein n=1 Tax=Dichomitus squalens TaxID=114155 RepID=A0A4Q9MK00_9APHY|nr:hypothetical protein BD311DRAFT_386409 [Dichomitus squalens]
MQSVPSHGRRRTADRRRQSAPGRLQRWDVLLISAKTGAQEQVPDWASQSTRVPPPSAANDDQRPARFRRSLSLFSPQSTPSTPSRELFTTRPASRSQRIWRVLTALSLLSDPHHSELAPACSRHCLPIATTSTAPLLDPSVTFFRFRARSGPLTCMSIPVNCAPWHSGTAGVDCYSLPVVLFDTVVSVGETSSSTTTTHLFIWPPPLPNSTSRFPSRSLWFPKST